MPLHPVPYDTARPLVKRFLSLDEDEGTADLIRELRAARRRGYLRRSELEAICYWKSPRAIRHIRSNSAHSVRAATTAALATPNERVRLETLLTLQGVSVPMASSILTLLDPRRYGVIDIRVWELLHRVGTVNKNPGGVGFTFDNWYEFLMVIRHFARIFSCTARHVERALFLAHKQYQKGQLYSRRGS